MAADRKSELLAYNDPRLGPLIEAEDEDQRQEAIEGVIVEHARPLIDTILGRARNSAVVADREDIAGTIVLRLVRRLRQVPERADDAIVALDDFVAALTSNAVYDVMRRRFPERTRLKNRVRYVILHDARFALHTGDSTSAALASWPAPRFAVAPLSSSQLAEVAPEIPLDRTKSGDAIDAILHHFGRAVLVDDIVRLLATAWSIVDAPAAEPLEDVASDEAPAVRIEARDYLLAVWKEICVLPPHQRAALLLNLRDPDYHNVIALFVMTGIVSADRLAGVLDMTTEQLAAIWNDLPLDDHAIGERLGVARQQVINYRRSARERLARRLKKR